MITLALLVSVLRLFLDILVVVSSMLIKTSCSTDTQSNSSNTPQAEEIKREALTGERSDGVGVAVAVLSVDGVPVHDEVALLVTDGVDVSVFDGVIVTVCVEVLVSRDVTDGVKLPVILGVGVGEVLEVPVMEGVFD